VDVHAIQRARDFADDHMSCRGSIQKNFRHFVDQHIPSLVEALDRNAGNSCATLMRMLRD